MNRIKGKSLILIGPNYREADTRPYGYKKLKAEDAYWLRVGDYRVIYEIDDSIIIVTVVSVGHRKDIYK